MAVVEKIGSVFDINATTTGIQFVPAISALKNGGFVVTWTDFNSFSADDPSESAVRAQIFDDQGFRSGPEILVPTLTNRAQASPDVATLSDGSFIITWTHEFSDTDIDIKAQRFAENGSRIGGEVPIAVGGQNEFDPSITPGADGGLYVVTWTDESDGRIHFRQNTANGDSITGGLADPAGGLESESSTTTLLNGDIVVAFRQNNDIFHRALVGNEPADIANTTFDGEQRQPTVEALENSNYIVVWNDRELFVKARMFTPSGTPFTLEEINLTGSPGSIDFTTPIVTALPGGGFILVWDDRNAGLRAQAFDDSGDNVGGVIQLTSAGASGAFGDVDVTVRKDGDVVVVWGSETDGDVKGQVVRVFNQVIGTNGDDRLANQLNGAISNLNPGFQANDSISGRDGDDVLQGFGGARDILDGGNGRDVASYIDSASNVTANLLISAFSNGDAIGDQYISIEGLEGSFFNDDLTGNNGNNLLDGVDGNDTLVGGAGNDTVLGNFGNDVLEGGNGNDTLDGQNGNDDLDGGGGNDTYVLGNGGDDVTDSGGTDTITSTSTRSLGGFGAIEHLTLLGAGNIDGTGNGLNNTLTGNDGNNKLTGGGGADVLIGGLGRDILTGGDGEDDFDFNRVTETGATPGTADRIVGFTRRQDDIDLRGIDARPGGGDNAFDYRGQQEFTAAGQVRLQQSGSDTIIEINTVGNDGAEAVIVLANINPNTLTPADFLL